MAHLIRVGDELFNPRYLIRAHPWKGVPDAPQFAPGDYRAVFVQGEEVVLRGPDVEEFLRKVAPFVVPEKPPPAPEGDPQIGRPLGPDVLHAPGGGVDVISG